MNPQLIEINTFTFVTRLSKKYGKPLTLSTIPDEEWRFYSDQGFDFIWLMGVWQRSPGARAHALERLTKHGDYKNVLPDCKGEDISGSPYAIYSYTLDPFLGKHEELALLKRKLNGLGLKLIFDFVPNHLALDHSWTLSHPDRFVQGGGAVKKKHPEWFFKTAAGLMMAHGRDPYFPPWADTVQINFFSANAREALIGEMFKIAEVSDGVRCDMAMLGLNHIFKDVWHECLPDSREPKTELWDDMIKRVKARYPEFLFIAEVYWDLETRLQELGFDYTYDKRFYDRLRHAPVHEICDHLRRPVSYQSRSVHFIENHDEKRAILAFGKERSLAAAAIVATIPGLRFFHDGQMYGKITQVPVQLKRSPEETADPDVERFYKQLFLFAGEPALRNGKWQLLDIEAGDHRSSRKCINFLAWAWENQNDQRIVIVNYGPYGCEGKVRIPYTETAGIFHDLISGKALRPVMKKTSVCYLPVQLPAWGVKLLRSGKVKQ